MNIVRFDSPQNLATAQATAMRQAPGPELMMISGGSTPRLAFEQLVTGSDKLSPGVRILLSDERVVPPSDHRSNTGWIAPLLHQAGLPPDAFTAIHCDLPEADALDQFQADLDQLIRSGITCTDAFLGIGADGHTCGLFTPDAARRDDVLALAMDRADGLRGISVTHSILRRFKRCILTVSGSGKADIIRQLMEAPDTVIAGIALRNHPQLEIWGDSDALALV